MKNINMSPDSELGTSAEVDPLNENVEDVKTSFPLLQPDRIYRFEVTEAVKSGTKADPDENAMLTVKAAITKDATDTDGNPLYAGFPVTHRIMLKASAPREKENGKMTKGRTLEDVKKDIALLAKSCGIKGVTARQIIDAPGQLVGKIFDAKTPIEKGSGSFGDSNKLSFIIPS